MTRTVGEIMSGKSGNKNLVIIAFAMNTCIAVVKSVVASITSSSAMLAEAIHSWADSGNQLLLLLGIHLSQKKPDEKTPVWTGQGKLLLGLYRSTSAILDRSLLLDLRGGS